MKSIDVDMQHLTRWLKTGGLLAALCIHVAAQGQWVQNADVLDYISRQKDYVSLTDKAHLPAPVQRCYTAIEAFCMERGMALQDLWTRPNDIRDSGNTWEVPIYHYDGFARLREMEHRDAVANRNRKPGDLTIHTVLNGNASGKDGYLSVAKEFCKVIAYSLWQ